MILKVIFQPDERSMKDVWIVLPGELMLAVVTLTAAPEQCGSVAPALL